MVHAKVTSDSHTMSNFCAGSKRGFHDELLQKLNPSPNNTCETCPESSWLMV